jgi:protein-disulfide isomerase
MQATMNIARAGLAAALFAALGGCSSSPSPQELQATLEKNPQILYSVIEKHPAEFLDVLNKAVAAAQAQQQEASVRAESRRRDEEFSHPKIPLLTDRRAVRGNPAAPVTIVEYTDFQCPYCRREEQVLREVLGRYPGRVKLVLKQTPLSIHPQALPAAQMYEAIAMQSPEKAWRFHDLLFANQDALESQGPAFIAEAARQAGADVPRALRDAQGRAVADLIASDQREAKQFGFSGTPGLLVNGVSFDGAYPPGDLESVIDRHLQALGKA